MALWKKVSPGQPPRFSTPDELWKEAVGYFEWCQDNVLEETKIFNNQGEIVKGKIPHMRAMTQAGLCSYLNISFSTYHNYKNREAFLEVTQMIDAVMYEQKYTGAAAGFLNANIVARDLGLNDKKEEDTEQATPVKVVVEVQDASKRNE